MIRPSQPLQRRKPAPQLALALEHQRPRTIKQQAQDIHARVELLRKQTYLLTLPNRQF